MEPARLAAAQTSCPSSPLHRFFGDIDGDRDVDFADTYWFKKTWLRSSNVSEFDARLDLDGDGVVATNELSPFTDHYFRLLPPQPAIFATLVGTEPTISGNVLRTNEAANFGAQLSSIAGFSDATSDLSPDGTFRFGSNRLAGILGGPLTNGFYNLELIITEMGRNCVGHIRAPVPPWRTDRLSIHGPQRMGDYR